MRKKNISRLAASVTALVLGLSAVTGCGSGGGASDSVSSQTESAQETASASDKVVDSGSADAEGAEKYPEFLTIDVFGGQSNYQGLQSGWFAKLVRDKFNMELNIIAPNVAGGGDTLFQTRSANGNLGDIILTNLDRNRLKDLVQAELVLDMTDYIDDTQYLKNYLPMIETVSSLAEQDGLWAVPSSISEVSATEPGEISEPTNAASLRWDLYKEVGYPKISTLEDLLPVLQQMQEAAGTSDSGQPVYAFSLFSDWDGDIMQNAGSFSALYGYDPQGYALFNIVTGETQSMIADDSYYVRGLKFLFDANQLGLVDPESTTQNFDTVSSKFADGAVIYSMWPWLGTGYYNSQSNMEAGKGFQSAVIEDASYLCWGSSPAGSTSYGLMIGSNTADPQRMVDFVDWLYSPEGVAAGGSDTNNVCGPEGLTWELVDGEPQFTELGMQVLIEMDSNALVPDEWGGGTYSDGISALNYSALGAKDVNPENGVPYNFTMWDAYQDITSTALTNDWREHYGTEDSPIDYLDGIGKICVVPGSSWATPEYSTEINAVKEQCKQTIVDYSWRMVFAGSEEEFYSLLAEMQEIAYGLGYNDVLAIDEANAAARYELFTEVRGE